MNLALLIYMKSVSYTHLDVYKRQYLDSAKRDSILHQQPFCHIRLISNNNATQEMTFYKIYYPDGIEDSFGRIIYEDRDLLHGYNEELGLVTCQYYVVASFFQPITYFVSN